ncbi:MFS transporter [Streptomyces sp. NPDC002133]|uniref:MFS transporter n=1 Tax=Streptomyces sp. NPDC002133 TaxID=3154409 RepID=UPI00332C11E4
MPHPTTAPSSRLEAGTSRPWAPTTSTVTLLTAVGVLVVGQMYTVLALLDPMAVSLTTTPDRVTWTATAFGFAYAAGFLLSGPLSDRYGPRTVITVGLLAATATTAAVSAAPKLCWADTRRSWLQPSCCS